MPIYRIINCINGHHELECTSNCCSPKRLSPLLMSLYACLQVLEKGAQNTYRIMLWQDHALAYAHNSFEQRKNA